MASTLRLAFAPPSSRQMWPARAVLARAAADRDDHLIPARGAVGAREIGDVAGIGGTVADRVPGGEAALETDHLRIAVDQHGVERPQQGERLVHALR
jgi:hypothetical protein